MYQHILLCVILQCIFNLMPFPSTNCLCFFVLKRFPNIISLLHLSQNIFDFPSFLSISFHSMLFCISFVYRKHFIFVSFFSYNKRRNKKKSWVNIRLLLLIRMFFSCWIFFVTWISFNCLWIWIVCVLFS